MRVLLAALLVTTAMVSPSHAEPISAGITALGFWYAGLSAVGQLAVQIGIGLALTAASFGISYLLGGGGSRQQTAVQNEVDIGVQVEEQRAMLERRRLYGTVVVSGGVFFQKTTGGTSGAQIFVKGYTLSDGVCDGLESIIINGIECPVDQFGNPQVAPWYNDAGNKLKVSFRSGADDQAMDTIIATYWASPPDDFYPDDADRTTLWAAFRQRGVATVVVEMQFGADAEEHTELWGAAGIPDLKFRVRGLHIFDKRDSNQSATDPTTWGYSDNATLVEADWLTSDMGFGIDPDEIEWESIKASANIDDDWLDTLDGLERRGRINGLVLGSEANDSVLSTMALQNRALVRRAFGLHSIRADSISEPVCTIHQDLIVGAINYQNEVDTRAAINRAEIEFAPASKLNQSDETAWEDAALITLDGQTLPQRLSLRFADTPGQAQRLGYATIKDNRAGRTFSGTFDLSVLNAAGKPNGQLLEAGDVVRLWLRNYQAVNGLYTVSSLEIGQDFTVALSLAGYDPDAIAGWSSDIEIPFEEAA